MRKGHNQTKRTNGKKSLAKRRVNAFDCLYLNVQDGQREGSCQGGHGQGTLQTINYNEDWSDYENICDNVEF